ncbi:phospholipase C 3-like protein [Corchorus olitorius]|uniref:Phospholipase C 3-like protein n=1 Tax=Corchorus olitorius TaxID=93759 RepID=A0A1R3HES0_9ROSI|nr:phospholipase C 3-like protein [Corchorus olitorius]
MTVSTGLKKVEDAFRKFYDDGKKEKEINGAGAGESVSVDAEHTDTRTTNKTSMQQMPSPYGILG